MRYAQSLGNCYQSRLLEEYERAKSKYLVDLEVYNFKKKDS